MGSHTPSGSDGTDDPAAFLGRVRDRRAASRGITPEWVESKIQERAEARGAKDFARADGVRDELAAKGVELHDDPAGTSWSMT